MRVPGWSYIRGGPRGAKHTGDDYYAWPCREGFVVDAPDGRLVATVASWAEVEAAVDAHRKTTHANPTLEDA